MRSLLRQKRIWIVLLAAALLLAGCGQAKPEPTPTPTAAPTPAPTPTPTPAPTPAPTPTPAPASGSDLAAPPASNTDLNVPETPKPTHAPVDDSFFADAAFLGNSLMEGLHLFGGLRFGDFYSGTSASVISVNTVTDFKDRNGDPSTMVNALLEQQYGKIFVLFGINELGFYVDGFIDIYSELLAEIKAGEPNARIFIFSLTPVTMGRSTSDDLFTRERVELFNMAVKAMAEREGYEYMDLYSAMANADGWLPGADSTDGIHFTAPKFAQWSDFLRYYPYPENGLS